MPPTGLDDGVQTLDNTNALVESDAIYADLIELLSRSPTLPAHVRAEVMALLHSSQPTRASTSTHLSHHIFCQRIPTACKVPCSSALCWKLLCFLPSCNALLVREATTRICTSTGRMFFMLTSESRLLRRGVSVSPSTSS